MMEDFITKEKIKIQDGFLILYKIIIYSKLFNISNLENLIISEIKIK